MDSVKEWFVESWPPEIDASGLLPLKPRNISTFNVDASQVLGTEFAPFVGCLFICDVCIDLEKNQRITWRELAENLGVTPRFEPGWSRYLGDASKEADKLVNYFTEITLDEENCEWLAQAGVVADNAVADEALERAFAFAYNFDPDPEPVVPPPLGTPDWGTHSPGVEVMQDIPVEKVKGYLQHERFLYMHLGETSSSGLSLEEDATDALPNGLSAPRAQWLWDSQGTFLVMQSVDVTGALLFFNDESIAKKVAASSEIESFPLALDVDLGY